jgi:hypothetical protein
MSYFVLFLVEDGFHHYAIVKNSDELPEYVETLERELIFDSMRVEEFKTYDEAMKRKLEYNEELGNL